MPSDLPPFSNHTEWEMWEVNWCDRCLVDAPYRNGLSDQGCPLLVTAMLGQTPDEWIEQPPNSYPSDAYHCINFKPPGWRSPDPRPIPDPPDQTTLFDRTEAEGVRMLTTAPSEVSV